jgi:ATPases with chaperone activity, ATP-binding subunit
MRVVKLSDRYITDRLLPDKAIDVMDEVGARVHLKNINVPKEILDLEKKIEDVKVEKNKVVKSQKFEEAASLRDTENVCRKNWKSQGKLGRRKQTPSVPHR